MITRVGRDRPAVPPDYARAAAPDESAPAGATGPGLEILTANATAPLDWQGIFGNANPVEVEIGTGKGRFLIEAARSNPAVNYAGIERSLKWMRFARARIEKAGLGNVRLVRAEAYHFLDRFVPPGSLQVIHAYFPDPWPKRRHEKRRLFRPGVGAILARCLRPGGALRVATDHEEYFGAILSVLAEEPAFLLVRSGEVAGADLPGTHFEVKYRAEGRRILGAEYRKS